MLGGGLSEAAHVRHDGAMSTTFARVEREIASLPDRGLRSYELRRAVAERVAGALSLDGWCFATADPDTLMMTSHCTAGIDRSAAPALYETEYCVGDVASHEELAESRWPVRVLSEATGGELWRSARYREVFTPLGIGHELRAAVRDGGATWGFMHLFRGPDRRDFDADEAAFVERIGRLVGPALRGTLVGPQVRVIPAADAPGLIVLDERHRLAEGTPGGHAWVAALRDPEQGEDDIPEVFVSLSIRARGLAARGSTDVARARMPGEHGEWYSITATCTDRGRTAIIVQPSAAAELVPLLLRGFRLTAAERQVTQLVLDGQSTRAICETLVVSPHTVQGHLKAIFDKVGVRSRRDLVARLNGLTQGA